MNLDMILKYVSYTPENTNPAVLKSILYDVIDAEKQDTLIQSGAAVGQIVKIAAVDENGKPTNWISVDNVDSDDDILSCIIDSDMMIAVTDADGAILTDENGKILLM